MTYRREEGWEIRRSMYIPVWLEQPCTPRTDYTEEQDWTYLQAEGVEYIERSNLIRLPDFRLYILCDEDGQLKELPTNIRASSIHGAFVRSNSMLVGPIMFCMEGNRKEVQKVWNTFWSLTNDIQLLTEALKSIIANV